MGIAYKIGESLQVSLEMFWEVLWPLILGFLLSAIVQSLVSHKYLSKLLGKNSLKSASIATFFGMCSSSCSYAAVALARSLFTKGASFTNAMIFEIASTNLVIEIGIILIVLMGWQFMAAEFIGGFFMILIIAILFRLTLSKKLINIALANTQKNITGKMEGHASMDMSLKSDKSLFKKLFTSEGYTAISHYFVADTLSIWTDLVTGFLVAGFLAVFIPPNFWKALFLANNPFLAKIEGPLIGPFVAIISFVCSVGNIPLAAVLWKGGISFGGVASFIFADLIVLPVLNIYRKYYGFKVMAYIAISFYFSMALAGYLIEILFEWLKLIPVNRNTVLVSQNMTINYTTFLNLAFILLTIALIARFFKTGGMHMLKMMSKLPDEHNHIHH